MCQRFHPGRAAGRIGGRIPGEFDQRAAIYAKDNLACICTRYAG